MRHAICYISNLKKELELPEIEALLSQWQEKNENRNIKGLLLYFEGNFFQILEGEKNQVLRLFETIQEDHRHEGIVQVIGRDIEHGSYNGYVVDIVTDEDKYSEELPGEYVETLKGVDPELRKTMEHMLEIFIDR